MNLKTFQADSMQEALAKVREELGEDAVIVKTRQTSRKLLGKSKPCYEVTAAVERPPAAAPAAPPATGAYDWKGRLPRVSTKPEKPAPAPKPAAEGIDDLRAEIEKVRQEAQMPTREMRLLRDEIQAMLESASTPGAAATRLQALDLSDDLGSELCRRAAEHPEAHAHPDPFSILVPRLMAEDLRCAGGIRLKADRPTRILLLGPSGSGKSSLLQKLAAKARLAGKRVGILSADSRRIGAHSELTHFAKTLGLPMAAIFSSEEIPAARHALRACDLILADAPFSPNGDAGWSELQNLRQAFEPDETHLVLNACMRERELKRVVHMSMRMRPTHLSFTRLDECLGFGSLYATTRSFSGSLGYLISGPASTGAIEPATPSLLCDWFAKGLAATASDPVPVTRR